MGEAHSSLESELKKRGILERYSYHVQLEQEKQEEEDAEIIVDKKVELKHHAK